MLGDRTRFGEVEVALERTPNEIALNILLAVLTLIFLLVVVTLQPFAAYAGTAVPIPVLIPLLVCLIPTTIGALISALGGREIRKGAGDAVAAYVKSNGGKVSTELQAIIDRIARAGGTPLHQDGDDHRRQPAHRGVDRGGGRCR